MNNVNSTFSEKDKNVYNFKDHIIVDVSSYINKVKKYVISNESKDIHYLYRGECEIYETSCRPNIFRKNVLETNEFFEKSLFDSMRQNYLSSDKSYLTNAIDAQHGEFPSRLLDVSYNSLVALYFAVTPYYHHEPDKFDKIDGMVFVFSIDDIFSPSAKNISDNYDAVINRDKAWLENQIIFEKNHKFIDHTKLNKRIVAQQGAFILFQGQDASDLPPNIVCGIRIPGEKKKILREELSLLFGIHTGSIYPEMMNLVEDITEKSKKTNSEIFCCKNELKYVLVNLKKELDYYLEYLITVRKRKGHNISSEIRMVEKKVNSYRIGLLKFYEYVYGNSGSLEELSQESLMDVISEYNRILKDFDNFLKEFGIKNFSLEGLRINLRGKSNE